ncbi:MAG: hypothetical protein M1834_007048 [Cirrosporium novae-zelandiae]|nr:MAG: hypothetical protein M1834_007048 [Cirrosporium novae-zelandiae]
MLGRLLHKATSSLNPNAQLQQPPPLESVTEEEHTRNLLFPDPSLLQRTQSQAYPLYGTSTSLSAANAGSFDDLEGLHLDPKKDFRVIIAQDAIGPYDEPILLFDSQSESPEPTFSYPPESRNRRSSAVEDKISRHQASPSITSQASRFFSGGPPSPRRLQVDQTIPISPTKQRGSVFGGGEPRARTVGAFDRARMRNSSISSAPPITAGQEDEVVSEAQRTRTMVHCMFGTATLSYKGPSTKIHIFSADSKQDNGRGTTANGYRETRPSSNYNTGRQRTPLSRSSTGEGFPKSPNFYAPGDGRKLHDKRTLLVTRTFALHVDTDSNKTPLQNPFAEPDSYPFPRQDGGGLRNKAQKAKQNRTPLFAIAIVLQLPKSSQENSRPPSGYSMMSPPPPSPFAQAMSSDSRSSWLSADSPFSHGSLASDWSGGFDGRLDSAMEHWDIITRTLSYLEGKARLEIMRLLKHAELGSPAKSPLKDQALQRPKERAVHLMPNALVSCNPIKDAVDAAGTRVCSGLSISKVLRGQGRWGIWREEARWIERWVGYGDQSFFFNLLTVFLGNHTEWLNTLGPSWYKRRHRLHQKHRDDNPVIPSRTVIISNDKMVARRLIFLLSAFLPSSSKLELLHSPHRPRRPTSARTHSGSPPTGVGPTRQESLRRTINRRRREHQPTGDEPHHERSISFSTDDGLIGTSPGPETRLDRLDKVESSQEIDKHPISAALLPLNSADHGIKCRATTTATATPMDIMPAPHFTTGCSRKTKDEPDMDRDGEVHGLACANLTRTLQRSQGTNVSTDSSDSRPNSKWGSLISSFWSGHGESSATDESDVLTSSQEGLGISNMGESKDFSRHAADETHLSRMTKEAAKVKTGESLTPVPHSILDRYAPNQDSKVIEDTVEVEPSPAKAIPDSTKSPHIPLTLSVNEKDGVIDVDIPLPSFFGSSAESSNSSPSKSHSLDRDPYMNAPTSRDLSSRQDADLPPSTAGWLKRYYNDFALQAVRPYPTLEVEIRSSMRDEGSIFLTPSLQQSDDSEKWTDVCTTVIADTKTMSIKRLRLQRRIKLNGSKQSSTCRDNLVVGDYEENIIEEPIIDMDSTLVDAVERVLFRSGQSSKSHSRSRSPYSRGRKAQHESVHESHDDVDQITSLEIPRGECKRMVLGALEQVARSVTAEWARVNGNTVAVDISTSPNKNQRSKRGVGAAPVDSTLREGVRRWLQEVEEGA